MRQLTEGLYVSGQVGPDDLQNLAAQGVRSIICNRPDGEQFGQPDADQMAEAASALGIQFRAIPLIMGQLSPAHIEQTAAALTEIPGPVLAYCGSGMRSTMLWALAQAQAPAGPGKLSGDDIIAAAADAGFDISGLRHLLDGA